MNMQTIQLDVSSDIYDKVIAFLELLPKDKVKLSIPNQSTILLKSAFGILKGKIEDSIK